MVFARLLFRAAKRFSLPLLLPLTLAACAATSVEQSGRGGPQIPALAQAIMDLGPGIDAEEAARAARIAYAHTDELALAYRITDPPLIHNTKVNLGLKPRGLCWHWAEDIEARLLAEEFQTLVLHRGIANHDKAFRIEHSTAIISRRGDPMDQGIVLDPWRKGGRLTWVSVQADLAYDWVSDDVVHAMRRARRDRAAKSPPKRLALRP